MKLFIVLGAILGYACAADIPAVPSMKVLYKLAPVAANGQLCDSCLQIFGEILNNETLTELLHRAEAFCDKLPGEFGQKCHEWIQDEGQKIIHEILTKFTPQRICTDYLHLCQQKGIFVASGKTPLCDPCLQVLGKILNKEVLTELLKRAESLCDRLPGELGTMCHNFIDQQGQKLIDEILAKYTPQSVCTDLLHLC